LAWPYRFSLSRRKRLSFVSRMQSPASKADGASPPIAEAKPRIPDNCFIRRDDYKHSSASWPQIRFARHGPRHKPHNRHDYTGSRSCHGDATEPQQVRSLLHPGNQMH